MKTRSRIVGPVLLVLVSACEKPRAPIDATVPRERAAALFAQEQYSAALAELEPLLLSAKPDPHDKVRAAIVLLKLQEPEQRQRAVDLLQAAAKELPKDPAVRFNLGRTELSSGDFEAAVQDFRRAHELLPSDYPTQLKLAYVLKELAYDEQDAAQREALESEALALYTDLRSRGVEFGGSWHLTTLAHLQSLYRQLDRMDDLEAAIEERSVLVARNIPSPTNEDLERGNLGGLDVPRPAGSQPPKLAAPSFSKAQPLAFEGAVRQIAYLALEERWHPLVAADLADERLAPGPEDPAKRVLDFAPSAPELVFLDARGLVVEHQDGAQEVLVPGPIERFTALDLGEDKGTRDIVEGHDGAGRAYNRAHVLFTDQEFALVRAGELEIWQRPDYWQGGPYELKLTTPLGLEGETRDLIAWDYDHDGDLDLALAGGYGARFLRNDGVDGSGLFADDTASFALAPGQAFDWLVPEDFDSDQDVDLLIGGPAATQLFDSLRGGKFADLSQRLPTGQDWRDRPIAADFDGDSFPDLFLPTSGTLLKNRFGEAFRPAGAPRQPAPGPCPSVVADVDLDGGADLLWLDSGHTLHAILDLGLGTERPLDGPQQMLPSGDGRPSALAAGSGQRFCVATPSGFASFSAQPTGKGLTLALKGVKDTAHGVGALVELRSGPIYRRIHWRGEVQEVGLGERSKFDVVRITWPNGVIQSQLDVPAGAQRVFEQIEGLVGSCPFLYTWDGERFVFVSDVLGITPLGLPIAPGVFVPPDHDEYVLIRGDQLKPKDGRYVLQFTEELREVTYLDQARLFLVDHPAGVEVYPNERFCFPPFPEEHLYSVERAALPLTALDDQGRDWAAELAAVDGRFAEPFRPNRGQYMGLTEPYTLTLSFDPALLEAAQKPRLVATGWFYWSDASVNMAIARHPDWDFVPPILEVPDGQGGWRPLGPPVGFPAGKTKTMVIDLEDALNPADPRLRLSSTLRLYWDRLELALDNDDAPRQQSEVPLLSAKLWERGFSKRVYPPGRPHEECGPVLLEWFDWDQLEDQPRWNMHPGNYTRFGDVLPLLGEVDDCFAILGSGDALTLEFDATKAPPLAPGQTRDYLLYLDGWAKDRDPNTAEALNVEPLPFHAMSGYPYGPEESYPDTPKTRECRRDWQTRDGKRWIESLAERYR